MSSVSPEKDSKSSKVIDVYLHAAKQEERMCKEIKKHLKPIIRNSKHPIEIHSDFDIPAGLEVNKYKEKLYSSEIVLAFISVDYLDSDECHRRTQKVIQRYNEGQTILIPILARNCQWRITPFVDLQLVPENLQPINNKQYWNSEDDALTEVADEIYEAIESLRLSDIPTKGIKSNWRNAYYGKAAWVRAKAFLLDIVITLVLPLLLVVIPLRYIWKAEIVDQREGFTEFGWDFILEDAWFFFFLNVILYILPLLLYLIICAIFESSKWRGTFGKLIMKLQTTDIGGNKITFFKALWRNILKLLIGGLWIFIPLDFIYFGESTQFYVPLSLALLAMILQIWYFGKSRKLIHDKISKTFVGEKLKR